MVAEEVIDEEHRPVAPHQAPPEPKEESKSIYIYRFDLETNLPVIVGKVFVDKNNDAWVRINAETLAAGIGVENIDGVALLDSVTFDNMES